MYRKKTKAPKYYYKTKDIYSVESKITQSQKDLIHLVDSIIETNSETKQQVFEKIQKYGSNMIYIFNCIEHAIKIRPKQVAALQDLLCLVVQKYGHGKLSKESRKVLIERGIIDEELGFTDKINDEYYNEEKKNPAMLKVWKAIEKDDLEEFKKCVSSAGFKPDLKMVIEKDLPYNESFETVFRTFYNFKSKITVTLMQVMAFYGSVNCFKFAMESGKFEEGELEKYAICGGNMEIIDILVKKGHTFEDCFMNAVEFHRNELCNWLLNKYKIKAIKQGRAIEFFNDRILFMNIQEGNVKPKGKLCLASYVGHFPMVKFLIDKTGASINEKDFDFPFHNACKCGSLEIVKYLYERFKIKVDQEDGNFIRPLIHACESGNLELVKYLIEKCHSVLEPPKEDYGKALASAMNSCNMKLVRYLVEDRHASLEAKRFRFDKEDGNALTNAVSDGNMTIVKYLIEERHCNTEVRDSGGMTPFQCACCEGNFELIKYLVEECHVCFSTDDTECFEDVYEYLSKKSLFYTACKKGNLEEVKRLFETGEYNIEQQYDGETALCFACEGNHLDVVKYLVEKCHANVDTEDRRAQRTALCFACHFGYLPLAIYLVKVGHANVEVSNSGRTPLEYAIYDGHSDVAQFLVKECNASVYRILNRIQRGEI